MKNLINCLLLIALIILSSCVERQPEQKLEEQSNAQPAVVDYSDTPRGISIQKIDGCEYIYAETSQGVAIIFINNKEV